MAARTVQYLREAGNQLIVRLTDGADVILVKSQGGMWVGSQSVANVGTNPTTPPAAPNTPATPTGVGQVTAQMVTDVVNSVGGSISAMMWTPDVVAGMFNDAINKAAPGAFSTVARLAAMVGEVGEECMWWQTMTEINGSSQSYAPYYGRGFIQLTWRNNYLAFGQWLVDQKVITDPNYFVNNPDEVATQQWAAYTAIYYFTQPTWSAHNLVWFCDDCNGITSGDWHVVSRAINRGSPYSSYAAYNETERNTAINSCVADTPTPQSGGTSPQTLQDKQNAVRKFALDHVNYFFYTEDLNLRNDMMTSHAGDCSAFYILCFTETLGMSRSVFGGTDSNPGWTGTLGKAGTLVNNSGVESDGPMQIGDAVLYSWGGSGYPWDHVALYIGNGQVASHGGPNWNDKGPDIQALSMNVNYAGKVQVRRFLS